MGLFHSPKCRLLSMLCLTFFFFLVEIIVGYFTNSTALIADSFHMLSDVVALVIAYVSVRMSPKKWSKNTFGWARAEVLGALINAVFLMALCFSILIESFKRIVDPEKLHNPMLILVVGVVGLCVNLVGLGLFHEHGHSHGGHTHVPQQEEILPVIQGSGNTMVQNGDVPGGPKSNSSSLNGQQRGNKSKKKVERRSAGNMNMRGVFLHVLADALGSIIVIISALIVQYTDWYYNIYVDPALSIIMVIIIINSTLPLLVDSALILLQTVPTHIQIDSLQRKLLEEIDGVLAVHEFHVWQLAGDRIIASAHIRCRNLHDYMQIAEKVKEFFHNEGIHSTTIQPEFVESDDTFETPGNADGSDGQWSASGNNGASSTTDTQLKYRWANDVNCALDCPPGQLGRESCLQNTCCGPQQKRSTTFGLDEIEIQKAGSSGQVTRRNRNIKSSSTGSKNPNQDVKNQDKSELPMVNINEQTAPATSQVDSGKLASNLSYLNLSHSSTSSDSISTTDSKEKLNMVASEQDRPIVI